METVNMRDEPQRDFGTGSDDGDGVEGVKDFKKNPTLLVIFGVVTVVVLVICAVTVSRAFSDDESDQQNDDDMPTWASRMSFTPEEFDNNCAPCNNVDYEIAAVICWKADKKNNEITIGMGAFVEKKSSYLAFGISDNGGMFGADVITFGDGIGLQDRFSLAFTRPSLDPSSKQDVTLETSGFQDGVMSFVFTRPIRVCMGHNDTDFDIKDGEIFVIWAFGGVSRGDIAYHGAHDRGVVDINFLSEKKSKRAEPTPLSAPLSKSKPKNSNEIDIRMHNGNGIPLDLETHTNGTDTYICLSFTMQSLPEKSHIYEVDVLIENPSVVHHMFLYHCLGADEQAFYPGVCRMDGCKTIVVGWGLGAYSRYSFPKLTGFPISENGLPEFFKLEIHYNTVTPPIGIRDSSGFRFRHRLPLGPDAGVGFFGWRTTSAMTIPPGLPLGSKNSTFVGYYPPECLPTSMGDEGLHIFSVAIHMHKYARKGILRHYRGDTELEPMMKTDYYDFNYQRTANVDRVLKRGDTMQLTCFYDTTSAKNPITGGEGTDNEMCLFFFQYYPRVKFHFDRNTPTFFNDGEKQWVYCSDRQKVILVPNNFSDSKIPYVEPSRGVCGA